MYELKQVIAVRKDLKMTKGKMSAQVAHASIESFRIAEKLAPNETKHWLQQGAKKVVVYVENQAQLMELKESLPDKMPHRLIVDAGLTQLEPGTATCLGIGPYFEEDIDRFTGKLKLVG
ncbi:MAG: peptidyl-tRNA hydrolase Pth2 [Candidatus Micrarchaeota archaeon]